MAFGEHPEVVEAAMVVIGDPEVVKGEANWWLKILRSYRVAFGWHFPEVPEGWPVLVAS